MGYKPEWFVNRKKQFRIFKDMLVRERPETFMLVEVPEPMGKTWLLRRMQQHCEEAEPAVPVIYIGFHDNRINNVDDLGTILLLRDQVIGQLNAPQHFERLNSEIGRHVGDPGRVFMRPMQLLADEMLTVFLIEDDLRVFARYVNASYEQLPGSQMREKAYQLVNYCREHNTLPQLLEELIRERDFKADDWTRLVDDILKAADSGGATGTVEFGATLQAVGPERQRILSAITRAFIECLADCLGPVSRFVLLIDTYDQCPNSAASWLQDHFLVQLSDEVLVEKLILVVAGRNTPYVREHEVINLIVRDEEHPQNPFKHGLLPFPSDVIAEYSRIRQVDEPWATPASLEMFSDGNPYVIGSLYNNKLRRRGR